MGRLYFRRDFLVSNVVLALHYLYMKDNKFRQNSTEKGEVENDPTVVKFLCQLVFQ